MINIREFAAPAGSASNFLSKNLLWAMSKDLDADENNAYEVYRMRDITNSGSFGGLDTLYGIRHSFMLYLSTELVDLEDLLTIYDNRIKKYDEHEQSTVYRKLLIRQIEDYKLDIGLFVLLPHYNLDKDYGDIEITEMQKSIIENMIKLYEFYVLLHQRNCSNSYYIMHDLLEILFFKNEKMDILNRKTACMSFDPATAILSQLLDGIKNNREWQINDVKDRYLKSKDSNKHIISNTEYYNRNVKFADFTFDYKQLFIDLNRKEIKKLYEFFNVLPFYEQNETKIINDMKNYHTANIKLVTELVPKVKDMSYIFR